ncbi:hypothetical protein, partial [Microbispora sp. NPDC049125]|uniref:hypothetical protein n=1 Tax=Microbispora sp. NPDC049125 TaxID=3154929 RepID=UPI003465F6A0
MAVTVAARPAAGSAGAFVEDSPATVKTFVESPLEHAAEVRGEDFGFEVWPPAGAERVDLAGHYERLA